MSAVTRVLRPLVGLLMEHGLTFQWLNGLLKSVFVDVAEKEFRLPDKRQTDSRITLLTGVHRKDVRRLREASGSGDDGPPPSIYLGAHLVAIWTGDDRFLDRKGHPKALSRLPRGTEPSFEELVAGVSTDIRPRAVLDEWLRLGAVEVDDDDRVRLKTEAFIPSKGFEEKSYYLGRNVHDHIAAARHNVQGHKPPMLERSVYYENLTPESVRELEELARGEGSRALQAINRRARELQARDKRNAGPGHKRAGNGRGGGKPRSKDAANRINFGIYFYHEREDPDSGNSP
jgi:hypothetical protein